VIIGRFRGAPSGSLTVKGTASGHPTPEDPTEPTWEQRTTATVAKDPAIRSIWARAHLRDLEDRYTADGPGDLEQRIVDTSLRFGVLCRFTAFVAVDSRVVAEGGTPHQTVQPVEIPRGWAAPAAAHATFAAAPMPPAPASAPPLAYGAAQPTARRGRRTLTSQGAETPIHAGRPPASANFQLELTNLLNRLHQVPDTHDQRLHHLLSELLPVLESIVQRMEAQNLDTKPLSDLRDDLHRLHPGSDQATVNALWTRALQTLTDHTEAPKRRRPFWKRNN
jgi:Ca-activated chloride channel family protein